MEIYIILILVIVTISSKYIFKVNIKKSKALIDDNKALDDMTSNLPDNIDICKDILKRINNEKVIVEENKTSNSSTSLYMVIFNKIVISNLGKSFIRFQTIAHECVHSIQNKKLQLCHFVLANLYNIGYYILLLLVVISGNKLIVLFSFYMILIGGSFLILKFFLEKDAILRSKEFAINFLKENKINKENIDEISEIYDKINKDGINFLKFNNIFNFNIKIIIYLIIIFFIN